jgi:hypothetical protein
MFTKGTEAHHQGRECVIVETNYLGIRIQYLDDETFLFIKASHFDELMMIGKAIEIKPAVDKRLLAKPYKTQGRFNRHLQRANGELATRKKVK